MTGATMPVSDTPGLATLAAVAPALARTAAQYDQVPYLSHPFPLTQPARLAAIATLFGLQPPPVPTARILEIGCAAGGNIIPLAARFPDAKCLGIDLSGVQIAQAHRRLANLGLTNIELRRQSVTELGPGDGPFDYVICHGVYSWVPAEVRTAILRVCAERLTDNGVAIVSYNVMPGWHMKRVVRDSMIAHAAHIPDPTRKIAEARWFLEFLKDHAPKDTPYTTALRDEAAFLANQRDDYVLHEFLEEENSPCTVTEFVTDAEKLGLGYLADSELQTMIAETYGHNIAVTLRWISGNRLLPLEQYIDILTGRTFRQSVLVKAAAAARADRALEPARLRPLHVTARLTAESDVGEDGTRTFRDNKGRTLGTRNAAVGTAIELLAARYPATATPDELVAAATRWTAAPDAEAALVMDALFRLMNAGMLDYYSEPVHVGDAVGGRPQAIAIARHDAASGSASTVNLRHEGIGIDPVARILLPLLDGTRDYEALCEAVLAAIAESGAELKRDDQPVTDPGERRRTVLELIDMTVRNLRAVALLEPQAVRI